MTGIRFNYFCYTLIHLYTYASYPRVLNNYYDDFKHDSREIASFHICNMVMTKFYKIIVNHVA